MSKIIYSNERIDGVDGRYINPSLYSGVVRGATLVMTNHNHIKEAYEAAEVEVIELPKNEHDSLDAYLENINDDDLRLLVSEHAKTIDVEYTKAGNLTKKTKDALDAYLEEKGAE